MNAASNQNCQWCGQLLIGIQQSLNCTNHNICNKCRINKRSCQSACPCCWYNNGSIFLSTNNICAVCGNGIKFNIGISVCDGQHKRCSQCPPSGCILCKFKGLRSWSNSSLDDLPADIQPIVTTCDILEKKYEETQQLNSNNANTFYDRQDSSAMDIDSNPVSIQNSHSPKPNTQTNDCRICLDDLDASSVTLSVCQHLFHKDCIEKWFQSSGKQTCPTCGYLYGINKGPQPPHGQMVIKFIMTPLSGFLPEQYGPNEGPTIEITYTIPSGIQGPLNPQPGQPYIGTVRTGYLPNNREGREILELLRRAFNDQHIFTVGKSTTTGRDNVVTWNDIHHKTQISGGPEHFGYPDPTYLLRVRQELADKGYK